MLKGFLQALASGRYRKVIPIIIISFLFCGFLIAEVGDKPIKSKDIEQKTFQKEYGLNYDQLNAVRMDNGCGYVDWNNNLVIPPFFEDAEDFSEDLGQVQVAGKWGYIDRNSKFAVQPLYDESEAFSEGLAPVCLDGKWGYIDKNGNKKIEIKYFMAERFCEGLAVVTETGKEDSFGFIDTEGNYKIKPGKFDFARKFTEGLAAVKDEGKWGYIDHRGKLVVPYKFDDALQFSNGLAAVLVGNKWGYINNSGKEVIPLAYEYAGMFTQKGALVYQDGNSLIIDKTGKIINSVAVTAGKKPDYPYDKKYPQKRPVKDLLNFMRDIGDNRLLMLLDLPGSHDSGTFGYTSMNWHVCQSMGYSQQFEWGVRVLDLRIGMEKEMESGIVNGVNYMRINHSGFKFGTLYEPAKASCEYLRNHPSETIIWLCKEEHSWCKDKGKYDPAFRKYTEVACKQTGMPADTFLYLGSEDRLSTLKLGECRRKVIVMTRQYNENEVGWIKGAPRLSWCDDYTWAQSAGDGKLWIQDKYGDHTSINHREKLDAMKGNRVSFNNRDPKKYLINYVSASYKAWPHEVCHTIEIGLMKEMSMLNGWHYGWTLFDFVGGNACSDDKYIRDCIVNSNYDNPRN